MPLPENIAMGWHALEGQPRVRATGDWRKHGKYWIVPIIVTMDESSEFLPNETHWWLRVALAYPKDSVEFFPDAAHGITRTFQHQRHNGGPTKGDPYRQGNPCLTYSTSALARLIDDQEPTNTFEKIRWHVERLLEWLTLAHKDELALQGGPFELPDLPNKDLTTTFGFREDEQTFHQWQGFEVCSGSMEVIRTPGRMLYAGAFQTTNGVVLEPGWGSYVEQSKNRMNGVWLKLPEPPILKPWQYPETLGELIACLQPTALDLPEILCQTARDAIYRQQEFLPVVLGYPIPRYNGEKPITIHWQALIFPLILKVPNGFRNTTRSLWTINQTRAFADSAKLQYLTSTNLNPSEIATRGRLPENVVTRHCFLIGAGALGSAVAEHLVRAGVQRMTIMDSDFLEVKNLVRHQLSLPEVGHSKAIALAKRLQSLNPNTKIEGHFESFPPEENSNLYAALMTADVIINATADAQVAAALSHIPFDQDKIFFALSLGWRAKKLYCYGARAKRFPEKRYARLREPHLEIDASNHASEELPWEGIGCYHPVFPARYDDVQLMTAIAIKQIEDFIQSCKNSKLIVVSQVEVDGCFTGLQTEVVE
jgi:ThiF family